MNLTDTLIFILLTINTLQLTVFSLVWVFIENKTRTIFQTYVKAWKILGAGIWWFLAPSFDTKK